MTTLSFLALVSEAWELGGYRVAIADRPDGAGYMPVLQFGPFVAVPVALRTVHEGLATALSLCRDGVWRQDSVCGAFLSGLVEPIGELVALVLTFRP